MARIYERLLSTNTPQEKRRDSLHPRSVNLSGKDGIWMVNRLEMLRMIDFFLLHD